MTYEDHEIEEDMIELDRYRNPRFIRVVPMYEAPAQSFASTIALALLGMFAIMAMVGALIAWVGK